MLVVTVLFGGCNLFIFTGFCGAGNQWGLQERVVAASSLEAFAQQLRQGKSAIQALLPAAEQPALDAFLSRTVDAAGTLFQPTIVGSTGK